jgi:cell division protein FtsN
LPGVVTKRNRRRAGAAPRRSGTPGWVLVIAGLAIGATVVATVFFVRDKLAPGPAPVENARPAAKPRPRPSTAPPEKRFEFYNMLPNFEVVVPEEDHDVRADKTPAPVAVPGVYVLQAGSYSTFAEADKVKAQLALLGVSAQIQKITVEERQYHRVRIGPIEDLDELNRLRRRLREAKIDVMLIRAGE